MVRLGALQGKGHGCEHSPYDRARTKLSSALTGAVPAVGVKFLPGGFLFERRDVPDAAALLPGNTERIGLIPRSGATGRYSVLNRIDASNTQNHSQNQANLAHFTLLRHFLGWGSLVLGRIDGFFWWEWLRPNHWAMRGLWG
jgi:hypothetical protein